MEPTNYETEHRETGKGRLYAGKRGTGKGWPRTEKCFCGSAGGKDVSRGRLDA